MNVKVSSRFSQSSLVERLFNVELNELVAYYLSLTD